MLARVLTEAGFPSARMGRNGTTSEDILHAIPGVHLECKFVETLSIPKWVRQAEGDCGGKQPVVVFRQSRQPWRAVVRLDYLLELLKAAA